MGGGVPAVIHMASVPQLVRVVGDPECVVRPTPGIAPLIHPKEGPGAGDHPFVSKTPLPFTASVCTVRFHCIVSFQPIARTAWSTLVPSPAITAGRSDHPSVPLGIERHADRPVLGHTVLDVLRGRNATVVAPECSSRNHADLVDRQAAERLEVEQGRRVGAVIAGEREARVLDEVDRLAFITTVAAATGRRSGCRARTARTTDPWRRPAAGHQP